MIRDELFKEYENHETGDTKSLEVEFEISDYEPRFAHVTGTLDLVIEKIEGTACVVGYTNADLFAYDQDGGELGEYNNIDHIMKLYREDIDTIESDIHPADLRG